MSKLQTFCGVVVPMVSPFTPAGEIDVPAVGRIVQHLLAGGVGGIFPLGTTGESASIHPVEKRKLVAATTKAVAGRAIVYAGISSNCFKESVEAAAAYRDAGADALVAHSPAYYPLSDDDIEVYFRRLADAVPLPLVLYNIPATTHHSIAVPTVQRLSDHSNIVAIKDSANDRERLVQLLSATGGRGGFPVLLGCSVLYSHGLRLGAVGVVPSGAHLVAQQYQAMYEAAMAKQWDKVDQLQKEADAVCETYLKGRRLGESLAVLKSIMEKRGLCSRTMLSPIQDFHANA